MPAARDEEDGGSGGRSWHRVKVDERMLGIDNIFRRVWWYKEMVEYFMTAAVRQAIRPAVFASLSLAASLSIRDWKAGLRVFKRFAYNDAKVLDRVESCQEATIVDMV